MAFPINPKWTSLCGCELPYMPISKYCQEGDCDIDLGIEAIVFENATLCVISLYSYWWTEEFDI